MIFVDTSAFLAIENRRDKYHKQAVVLRGSLLKAGKILITVEYVTPERIEKAWNLFKTFSDHEFSFTDCTSFLLMEHLRIKTAFTFDAHFKEYGKFTISP